MNDLFAKARSIDLYEYLLRQGLKPVRVNNRKAYFLSPKRNESNASMEVDRIHNRFSDYGEKDAFGSVIDFVMWMNDCDEKEAVRKILGDEQLPQYHKPDLISLQEPHIEVTDIKETIICEALIQYLEQQRKIPLDVANKYTKEVAFQFASSKYAKHYGIGMPNDLGGWSIRGLWFKGSTKPAGISTTHFSDSLTINLFEGMFDFLSFIVLKGESVDTCVVLNSLVHIHMMDQHLRAYDKINAYFDNDEGGDDKMEWLLDGGYPLQDMRDEYADFNDINDFLVATYDF